MTDQLSVSIARLAGPLPDVADHVVQAVAIGRKRADRRGARRSRRASGSATGTVPATCLPSTGPLGRSSSPHANRAPSSPPRAARSHSASVGRDLPAQHAYSSASSYATCVTGCSSRPSNVAARSFGSVPARSRLIAPPHQRIQRNGPVGGLEDSRPRNQQRWIRVRVVEGIRRALGHRQVAGGLHETTELGHGDRMRIYPEALDADSAHWQLLGIEVLRAHQKIATGYPAHAVGPARCRSSTARTPRCHAVMIPVLRAADNSDRR